jgi:hypothetical protein
MHFTFDLTNFLTGLIAGGLGGSLITFRLTKNVQSGGNSNSVDQSRASAHGDIVGRDKRS